MAKKNLISLEDLEKFKTAKKDEETSKRLKSQSVAQRQEEIKKRKIEKSRRGCGCSRAKRKREQGQ